MPLRHLSLTLMAFFLKSVVSWPVGWVAHKSEGKSATAMRDRACKEANHRNVWAKSYLSVRALQYKPLPPALHTLCVTRREKCENLRGTRNCIAVLHLKTLLNP
jgi:hypothetical protein